MYFRDRSTHSELFMQHPWWPLLQWEFLMFFPIKSPDIDGYDQEKERVFSIDRQYPLESNDLHFPRSI